MVYRPLVRAFDRGRPTPTLDEVRSLLDEAPEEETRGRALFDAISSVMPRAKSDVLQFLIERDTNCAHFSNKWCESLLHFACLENVSFDLVRLLVKLNPDAVASPDEDGCLPLHYACFGDDQDEDWPDISVRTVEFLYYRYPPAIRMANNDIQSLPLHFACLDPTSPSVDVIRFLIEKYPGGVHAVDCKGKLPLHLASYCVQESIEVLDLLVDAFPGGMSTQDNNGNVPLHTALCEWNWRTAGFLLTKNPNVAHVRNSAGSLPIHNACEHDAPLDIIRLLIQANPASPTVQSPNGRLPLHDVCSSHKPGTWEVVQLLLEEFPDAIHVPDGNGCLPLHCACKAYPRLGQVRLLVQADPLTLLRKTPDGKTPVKLAFETSDVSGARAYLLEEQDNVMDAHWDAVAFVAGDRLDFPDLVVERIWQFAEPDVWSPEDDDDT